MNRSLFARAIVASAAIAFATAPIAVPSAEAAPAARKTAARPAPKIDLAPIEAQLRSREASSLRAGLAAARDAGQAASPVAPSVQALLADGLPADLAIEALQTLAVIGSEAHAKVVVPYAHHRDAKLRRKALEALTRLRGAQAAATLRHRMSDADPGVRGAAASGLGVLGVREAVPDLFLALDRKVGEAAGSIGTLCTPEQCRQLLDRTGRIGFDVLSAGLDQILFRSGSEVSDDFKLEVVGRVRELGTQEANRFLEEIQGRWPAQGSKRVKQAIDQAVIATSGGAGDKQGGAQ